MSDIVHVFMPRPGSFAETILAPGSAVVGRRRDGVIDCWYEGNIHGSPDMASFVDRLLHAGGRMRDNYPTIARATFTEDSLLEVASYDLDRLVVVDVIDAESLCAWSAEALEDIVGVELPVGRLDWANAFEALERDSKRPICLSSTEFLYRLKSGQILHLDAMRRSASVITHDDPYLLALIMQHPHVTDVERRLLTGTIPPEAPSP